MNVQDIGDASVKVRAHLLRGVNPYMTEAEARLLAVAEMVEEVHAMLRFIISLGNGTQSFSGGRDDNDLHL